MAKGRETPSRTPEEQENRMISLSMKQVEKQLRSGKAPAQVVTHFLKLGSEKARLERERLRNENELLKAKVKAIESNSSMETLYADAIRAMQFYKSGSVAEESYEDEEESYE